MAPYSLDTHMIKSLSSKQIKTFPTFFADTYNGIRLRDREIAFYKTTSDSYHVFLCLPYEENLDVKSGMVGKGANAVIKDWVVTDEKDAIRIINNCLTSVRMDKIE